MERREGAPPLLLRLRKDGNVPLEREVRGRQIYGVRFLASDVLVGGSQIASLLKSQGENQ